MVDEKIFSVFYCWQSDLRSACNRTFIQEALDLAVKELNRDVSVHLEVEIDRDTLNVPGSPRIDDAIFSKIDKSHAFVADVTIINRDVSDSRPSPNPNVLLELGYALRSLGGERSVLVMNTAFGGPNLLPFDLRNRRVLTYISPDDASERSVERRDLSRGLLGAIRTIIARGPRFPSAPGELVLSNEALQLLQNATESGRGQILFAERFGGLVELHTGDLSLNFKSRREANEWGLAIENLGNFGLVKPINESVFVLTARGLDYWEKLSRRGDCRKQVQNT